MAIINCKGLRLVRYRNIGKVNTMKKHTFCLVPVLAAVSSYAATNILEDTTIEATAYVHTVPELPDYLKERAAFWADTGSISVIDDGAGKLTQWRDLRETAAVGATPTRIYGVPAWTNGDTTAFQNVNPSVVTLGEGTTARKALYFNGRSGQYLRLKEGTADKSIKNVRNVFAVHFPSNWFGSIVGAYTESRRGVFQLWAHDNSYLFNLKNASNDGLFWNRVDLSNLAFFDFSSRVAIDGRTVDSYSYFPTYKKWQTLELSSCSLYSGLAETIFFQRYETSQTHKAGGDYLGEVLVFTNQLTRAEVKQVHDYLNAKWHFPIWRDEACYGGDNAKRPVKVDPTEQVEISSEAALTANVGADVVSRPYAFGGDGTIVKTGAGALVVGASEKAYPFAGELDLREGFVYLRGGRAPALRGKSGDVLTSQRVNAPTTAANCKSGGIKLSRSAGDAGVFVKAGSSGASVKAFDADVGKIKVNGGELTVGGASSVGFRGGFDVEVPNGDFEEEFRSTKGGEWKFNLQWFNNTLNHWTALSGTVGYIRVAKGLRFTDELGGGFVDEDPGYSGWGAYISTGSAPLYSSVYYPSGVGCQLLHLKMTAKACNKVNFPRRGYYELLFDATARYRILAQRVSVLLGDRTDALRAVSYCRPGFGSWAQVRIPLGLVEAGDHYIGFEMINSRDNSTFIDNVRVRFVSDVTTDAWPIPHGDFEEVYETNVKADFAGRGYMSMDNAVAGWTLSTTAPDGLCDQLNPAVAFVNDSTPMRSANSESPTDSQVTLYIGANTDSEVRHGRTCLCFIGDTSVAKTTFTPPAGRWRLRARIQRTYAKNEPSTDPDYATYEVSTRSAILSAKLTSSAGEVDLGTVSHARSTQGEAFPRRLFETAFVSDGQTEMTLALSNTTTRIGCLVDDLELVSDDSKAFADEELVKDGTFEGPNPQEAGWTGYYPRGSAIYRNCSWAYLSYLHKDIGAYGYVAHEGYQYLLLKGSYGMWQNIAFPASGLYRLRFAMRARTDGSNYENAVVQAYLEKDGVTNHIAHVICPRTGNFQEYEYVFNVPERGTYKFHFENVGKFDAEKGISDNYEAEATAIVDSLSIRRVDWDVAESVDMSPDTRLYLEPGATLNLSFTGTNEVRLVRANGKALRGEYISAQTHPDFVSGPGTLHVKPYGMVITVH